MVLVHALGEHPGHNSNVLYNIGKYILHESYVCKSYVPVSDELSWILPNKYLHGDQHLHNLMGVFTKCLHKAHTPKH